MKLRIWNRKKNTVFLLSVLLSAYCTGRQTIAQDRPMTYEAFRPIFSSVAMQPSYQLIPTLRVAISGPTDVFKVINYLKEKFGKELHMNHLTGGAAGFECPQERLISILDALYSQYKFKVESYSNSRSHYEESQEEPDYAPSSVTLFENSEKRLITMIRKETNALEKLKQEHELEKVKTELKQLRSLIQREQARKPILEFTYIQSE